MSLRVPTCLFLLSLGLPAVAQERTTLSVDFRLEIDIYLDLIRSGQREEYVGELESELASLLGKQIGFLGFAPGESDLRLEILLDDRTVDDPDANSVTDETFFVVSLREPRRRPVALEEWTFRAPERYRDDYTPDVLRKEVLEVFERRLKDNRDVLIRDVLSLVSVFEEGTVFVTVAGVGDADQPGGSEGAPVEAASDGFDFVVLPYLYEHLAAFYGTEFELRVDTGGSTRHVSPLVGLDPWEDFDAAEHIEPHLAEVGSGRPWSPGNLEGRIVCGPLESSDELKTGRLWKYTALPELPGAVPDRLSPASDGFVRAELAVDGLYVTRYELDEEAIGRHGLSAALDPEP